MKLTIWNRSDRGGARPFKGKQTSGSKRTDQQALAVLRAKTPSAKKAAQAALVSGFMPLIKSVSQSYATRNGTEFDDVMQDATMGLLRACELWRPQGGVCFLTHATRWIHALANRNGMSHDEKNNTVRSKYRQALRLDEPLTGAPDAGDDGATWADALESDAPNPLDVAESEQRARIVRGAVQRLPRLQREIMEARTFKEETLEVIGTARGVSRERIRQVEAAARAKIQRRLASFGFGPLPAEDPAPGRVRPRRDAIGLKLYRSLREKGVHPFEAARLVAEARARAPRAA